MPRTKAKSSAARSRAAQRKSAGKPFSSGFAYGAITGAVVALALVYVPGLWSAVEISALGPAPRTSTVPTVDFEFMYRLPKERVVTDVEPYQPPLSADPAEPVADQPASEFLLQAAAFRGRDEADTMRARMILENMAAEIESVRDSGGVVWHRVLVGPFPTKAEMQQALTTLRGMGIPALALERPRG